MAEEEDVGLNIEIAEEDSELTLIVLQYDDENSNPEENVYELVFEEESSTQTEANESEFACSICHKTFARKHYLQQHLLTHSNERPFICSECDKRFVQKAHLRTHLLTHSKIKAFECSECGKAFHQKNNLQKHLLTHSKTRNKYEQSSQGYAPSRDVCNNVKKVSSLSTESISYMNSESYNDITNDPMKYITESVSNDGENSFACKLCGKHFVKIHYLKKHIIGHTLNSDFICDQCSKKFSSKLALDYHCKNVHASEKIHKCEKCSRSFSRKNNLHAHQKIHSKPDLSKIVQTPYKCEICNGYFSCSTSLKIHIFTHSETKPYQCELCDKRFRRSDNLTMHLLTHTKKSDKYICDICSERVQTSAELRKHLVTHKRKKRYTCDRCSLQFPSYVQLCKHKRTLHNTKKLCCSHCKLQFLSKCQLIEHGKSIHKNCQRDNTTKQHSTSFQSRNLLQARLYKCENCGENFDNHQSFVDHKQSHTSSSSGNIRQVDCDHSVGAHLKINKIHTKTFSSSSDICQVECDDSVGDSEVKRVEDLDNCAYSCDECNEKFSKIVHLQKHLRMHKTGNEYTCRVCSRCFMGKYSFRKHMKLHASTEKMDECHICGKGFSQTEYLKRHISLHNAKSFKCEICKKNFSQKWHLVSHRRTHTGEKPFECKVCKKNFARKDSLRIHMGTHNRTNIIPSYKLATSGTLKKIKKPFIVNISVKGNETILSKTMNEPNLLNYQESEHSISLSNNSKDFMCFVCCEVFDDEKIFKLHLKHHKDYIE